MPRLTTLAVLACASALTMPTALANGKLSVPLVAKGGASAGSIDLTDTPNGVLVLVTLPAGAVPAGEHAMHFHQTGDCSDTEKFEKSGGHYNPTDAQHGFVPEGGPARRRHAEHRRR
jgi:Cu-Zn family superoxide dismutase